MLYPKSITILEELQQLKDEVAMAGQTVAGELIIGASTIPGAYLLPTIAASFKNRYPGISFEISINDSANIIADIQANKLFLGIVGAKLAAKQISYAPFAEDELILIASGQSNLPETIHADSLSGLPLIFREVGSGTRKSTEIFLADQNIGIDTLNIVATLGSSTAAKEAVKADLGLSFISKHAVCDELETGSVRRIRIPELSMLRTLYIATATKRTLPHHYQVFLRTLTDQGLS